MTEHEPHLQSEPEQSRSRGDASRQLSRFIAGAVATGVVVVGWNALPGSNSDIEEPTEPATATASPFPEDEISVAPSPTISPQPATPTPSLSEAPQSSFENASSKEAVTGQPNMISIGSLSVEAPIDYSNVSTGERNNCNRYGNPCAGEVESLLFKEANLGVAGVDKLAKLTFHTSYGGEPDVGAGLIYNPIDEYTHFENSGLQVGDRINFAGYNNDDVVTAEIIPFPKSMTIGEPVPDSPGVYFSKQEGMPEARRTLLTQFVNQFTEVTADDGEKYIMLGMSYAGTGENGFEMSPDPSSRGRANSAYLLARVIDS